MDSKGTMINRLQRAGLRPAAEAYRDEVRIRLKAAGTKRAQAVETAWGEMWSKFEPIVLRLEQPDAGFIGYQGDVDSLLDPEYHEKDAGKRLRDAFVWVGDEFRRITTDSPTGTRMDFSRAKTPPPSPLAIQIAEHYAMQPPGKRTELLARLAGFATKTHSAKEAPEPEPQYDGGGFWDEIS